ncbi:MAG TPA: macro domain-containing protein [Thermoanaerobaculia bacterium]|nr:macro domain-containing protein [Thermoanaerobaculia bacterium]
MRITIFTGDLTDAPAEALCTSTNPRLSLMMGTGGSVRDRGGFEVLREAEALLGGKTLAPGSVVTTSAGRLPYKAIFHCVASDANHRSSAEILRACVANALAEADRIGCASVAMPVFATGHAHFKFLDALKVMRDALHASATTVEHVIIVVFDADWSEDAERVLLQT